MFRELILTFILSVAPLNFEVNNNYPGFFNPLNVKLSSWDFRLFQLASRCRDQQIKVGELIQISRIAGLLFSNFDDFKHRQTFHAI